MHRGVYRVAGVAETRELDRCDVTTVRDIPVTSGARTGVDLASRLTEDETMAMTDDLLCSRATTRPWLHKRACHLAAGRAGVQVIARITRPGAGLRFHRLTRDRRRDSHKANRYAVSGRIPLRFTYVDVACHPEMVARQVREALRAAGHAAVSASDPV